MKIDIICVGKIKENYLIKGLEEYIKRMKAYASFSFIEVPDEKAPENLSLAEQNIVKQKEGNRILSKINSKAFVYVLAIEGKERTSESFSKEIETLMIQGKSHVVFIIGGSLGLSKDVLKRSDTQISFGKMTYPHQLMRLIVSEQIYRAFKIMRNEPYHK